MDADVKHTPGPWLWEFDRDGGGYVVWTRQPHTGELATVHQEDINGPYPAKANARLIAAAPALLEALRALLADSYPIGDAEDPAIREQALAAIALATGGDNAG